MQNFYSASGTTPRGSFVRRVRLLLPALAALLLCAGLAPAQQGQYEEDASPRRPTVNVRPFRELALRAKRLVDEGKLGPDTTLDVSATAECADDGRLKPESVKVEWHSASDETVKALAQQVISALSESRVLSALEDVKAVRLALKVDRQNVSVQVAGEMPSTSDAAKYADGYGLLVKMGLIKKRGTPEGRLYESLGFTSEGKMFKMSFGMPRGEVAHIIANMLARQAAKAAPEQD